MRMSSSRRWPSWTRRRRASAETGKDVPVPIGPWLALAGRDRHHLWLPIGSPEGAAQRPLATSECSIAVDCGVRSASSGRVVHPPRVTPNGSYWVC